MMNIENWAKSPNVSSHEYWEGCFPGYGEEIVKITSLFQNWIPEFGATDPELENDIRTGAGWMGVEEVRISTLSHADEAQATVSVVVDKALRQRVVDFLTGGSDHMHLHNINDAVGSAFGPVIGQRIPSTMLRSWLYGLLVGTIALIIAGDHEKVAQLEKILQRWKRGNYLIGFDTSGPNPKAVVIVADNEEGKQ